MTPARFRRWGGRGGGGGGEGDVGLLRGGSKRRQFGGNGDVSVVANAVSSSVSIRDLREEWREEGEGEQVAMEGAS